MVVDTSGKYECAGRLLLLRRNGEELGGIVLSNSVVLGEGGGGGARNKFQRGRTEIFTGLRRRIQDPRVGRLCMRLAKRGTAYRTAGRRLGVRSVQGPMFIGVGETRPGSCGNAIIPRHSNLQRDQPRARGE